MATDAQTSTRQTRPEPCPSCGYDLTGLSVSTCPECGGHLATGLEVAGLESRLIITDTTTPDARCAICSAQVLDNSMRRCARCGSRFIRWQGTPPSSANHPKTAAYTPAATEEPFYALARREDVYRFLQFIGASALCLLASIFTIARFRAHDPYLTALGICVGVIGGFLAFKVRKNIRRRAQAPLDRLCESCGHAPVNTARAHCSQCGHALHPSSQPPDEHAASADSAR